MKNWANASSLKSCLCDKSKLHGSFDWMKCLLSEVSCLLQEFLQHWHLNSRRRIICNFLKSSKNILCAKNLRNIFIWRTNAYDMTERCQNLVISGWIVIKNDGWNMQRGVLLCIQNLKLLNGSSRCKKFMTHASHHCISSPNVSKSVTSFRKTHVKNIQGTKGVFWANCKLIWRH